MTKDEAIKWGGGSVTSLARRLGLTHGAVSQWSEVPMVWQYRIQAMSGGLLLVDKQERKTTGGAA